MNNNVLPSPPILKVHCSLPTMQYCAGASVRCKHPFLFKFKLTVPLPYDCNHYWERKESIGVCKMVRHIIAINDNMHNILECKVRGFVTKFIFMH